jgi:hypothetical protein
MPQRGNVVITVIASSCDFSQSPVDLEVLIIDCIFLAVFVVIAWFWLGVKNHGRVSQKFPFWYGLALFWALVYDTFLWFSGP